MKYLCSWQEYAAMLELEGHSPTDAEAIARQAYVDQHGVEPEHHQTQIDLIWDEFVFDATGAVIQ